MMRKNKVSSLFFFHSIFTVILALSLSACGGGGSSDSGGNSGATLTEIQISPTTQSLPIGLNKQFIATGIFSDGSNRDISSSVSWTSSDTLVASDNSTGLFTANAVGVVTISASLNGISSDDTSASSTLTVTAAELASIAVTPTNPSTALGVGVNFIATGTYTDSSNQDISSLVTWNSASPATATVSNASGLEGNATPVATGTTLISASLNGINSSSSSASSTLTVTTAELVSIAVTPSNPSTALGVGVNFTATGTYTDSSNQDISSLVTWNSATPATATVSNASGLEGNATPVATGTTLISASLNGINSNSAGVSSTLTVTAAELVSIAITPTNPSTALGVGVNFTATGTYSDSSNQDISSLVTWNSATPATATVSNASGLEGNATPVATGTTLISASLGGINSNSAGASSTLTVTAAELVSIAVTPATGSITAGTTLQYTATGTYTDSSTQNLTSSVTWSSANNAIATIDNSTNKGLSTGVASGTVSIDATDVASGIKASDQSRNASLGVTVVYTSCRAILTNNPVSTSGVYSIDPDGVGGVGAFNVYCDMVSSGGGFTTYTIAGAYDAPAAEIQCAAKGLQLFVPRSASHLLSAVTYASTNYFAIMGIYPKTNGATCISTALNSTSCTTWGPKDGGAYFVSSLTTVTDPNGDNDVNQSMLYTWSGTAVSWYNDIPAGYSSVTGIVCSHPDEVSLVP
jgi:hypothetical protein